MNSYSRILYFKECWFLLKNFIFWRMLIKFLLWTVNLSIVYFNTWWAMHLQFIWLSGRGRSYFQQLSKLIEQKFISTTWPHWLLHVVCLGKTSNSWHKYSGPFPKPNILRYSQNSRWVQNSIFPNRKHFFSQSLINSSNSR